MNRIPRWLALASLSTLVALPAAAAEGDYRIQALDGTTVEALDGDTFVATTDGSTASVGVEGPTQALGFSAEGATQVVYAVAPKTNPYGYKLVYNKVWHARYRPQVSGFDGSYTLYSGGVSVAAGAIAGAAPFTLDRLPDAFAADVQVAAGGVHAEQIELSSWSFGGTTARFDDGRVLTIDKVEVSGHEYGHALGIHHTERQSVSATGVDALVVAVESDGELEAIETVYRDRASFDVSGNVVDEISGALSTVVARFPAAGYQRARFRVAGGAWGPWSAWTTARIERALNVPAAGAVHIDDYQLERRATAGTPTIAIHGYVKIKKLNSGG